MVIFIPDIRANSLASEDGYAYSKKEIKMLST